MKLHMGLVVLVKKMLVLINFLLQNINLVSIHSQICPDFAGHVWQDWHISWTLLYINYKMYYNVTWKKGCLFFFIFHNSGGIDCLFPFSYRVSILKMVFSHCLHFFHLLARKQSKFHNFHLSEFNFTCPGLQASGLLRKLGLCSSKMTIHCTWIPTCIPSLICIQRNNSMYMYDNILTFVSPCSWWMFVLTNFHEFWPLINGRILLFSHFHESPTLIMYRWYRFYLKFHRCLYKEKKYINKERIIWCCVFLYIKI